jgi:hypothetical protein
MDSDYSAPPARVAREKTPGTPDPRLSGQGDVGGKGGRIVDVQDERDLLLDEAGCRRSAELANHQREAHFVAYGPRLFFWR